jgi:hypothetical protein
VLLDIQAVLQTKRTEVVFRKHAGEEALSLVAELRNALVDNFLVYRVVAVHVWSKDMPTMRCRPLKTSDATGASLY